MPEYISAGPEGCYILGYRADTPEGKRLLRAYQTNGDVRDAYQELYNIALERPMPSHYEAREALSAALFEHMANRVREPMIEHKTDAIDNAARALVRALDGPAETAEFEAFMRTPEFHAAFTQYARRHALSIR